MTHHTDADRAEFEAWYEADAMPAEADWFAREKDEPSEYKNADTASAWRGWQAARRAPAAPVPQIAEVQDSLVAISAAIADQDDSAAQSMLRGLLSMLAAAPQPPEAAPVELPEYGIDTANHAGIRVRGYTEQQVRELLADQQFKLDELAMLTRMVVHAFRQVAPDNKTAAKTVDYLKRKGLAGNPLRAAQEQST